MTPSLNNDDSLRVLIVENDANELKAFTIGMKLEGITVVGVPNATEALEKLKNESFDAALIDLMMPGMCGVELAREVFQTYPDLTNILMSAYRYPPMQLAKMATGVCGFISKPFRIEVLVDFIRQTVEKHRDSGRIPASPSICKVHLEND